MSSRTKILVCAILLVAILGLVTGMAFWGHHVDFWIFVLMGFLGPLLFNCVCLCLCVVDDPDDDHHHDHGTSSDDHVIITINELDCVDPSVLIQSIPVVDFNSRNFGDAVECAVCLSELAEGDKAKVLPSCSHWFHAHCIDAWLHLHVTCPICRKRVTLFQIKKPISELSRFSSPVEPLAVTSQDANSDNPSSCNEHPAVVVDIPTSPETGRTLMGFNQS